MLLAGQTVDFDAGEDMVRKTLGPGYQYHTNLRSTVAHATRESLDYALTLLLNPTEGNVARAVRILRRVVALQVKDPASKWYGIWGWYLEEPPEKMSPADWNWADFNGSTLLMVLHYGAQHLPDDLVGEIREAIGHAARSIERRNVAMTYTNIAIKGTFVVRAAGKLLGDAAIAAYAEKRLDRLKATIEETGTFAEYNSPTYALVSMRNLVRMRVVAPDERAAWIERRLWLHLGKHWHQPTQQLAGPMSRCYATEQQRYLWIEAGLGNTMERSELVREDELLPWHCPENLRGLFGELKAPREHRELFVPAVTKGEFVQGTTYLHPNYCVGSTNRSNFWNQSAAVLVYGKRGHWRLRFFHDEYDFASAMVFTVQKENRVLGLILFRAPGGDKHVSLDPLPERFAVKRLEPRPEVRGVVPVRFESKMLKMPEGAESRVMSWKDYPEVHGYFSLEVEPRGEAEPVEYSREGDRVTVRWGGLMVSGLAKVATVNELDAAFRSEIDGRAVPYTRLSE